jgi:hypothetical protein
LPIADLPIAHFPDAAHHARLPMMQTFMPFAPVPATS